jgi:hypothetical protein
LLQLRHSRKDLSNTTDLLTCPMLTDYSLSSFMGWWQ